MQRHGRSPGSRGSLCESAGAMGTIWSLAKALCKCSCVLFVALIALILGVLLTQEMPLDTFMPLIRLYTAKRLTPDKKTPEVPRKFFLSIDSRPRSAAGPEIRRCSARRVHPYREEPSQRTRV